MARIPEGLRDLAKAATRNGWTITRTGSGHLKWRGPQPGQIVITPATPNGGCRSIRNSIVQLRKHGLTTEQKR